MEIFKKLDLQLFADAGTVTNTTTGHVNSYEGNPQATGAMSPTMKTWYETELLENARACMHSLPREKPCPPTTARRWNGASSTPSTLPGSWRKV